MKTLAIIILSVLFYLTSATAQTNTKIGLTDDEINELSSKLAMKILLNDTQKSAVTNLLKTYRTDFSKISSSSVQESQNKLISSTNEQIVALLDSKQQMKFKGWIIIRNWWKCMFQEKLRTTNSVFYLIVLTLSKGSPLPFEVKGSRPVLPQHWVVFFQPEADSSLQSIAEADQLLADKE